jgi:hypothetical protein
MAIKGESGFDAEKLRNLVAHFDNPNRNEATNAYVFALNEVEKIDDPARAKRLRQELKEAFDLATVRDPAATKKLDEIIKGLREQEAGEDADHEAGEDVDDWIPVADVPPAPPPRSDTPPAPPPLDITAIEPLPYLPLWKAVFWFALVEFACFYAVLAFAAGHPLTADDWGRLFYYWWSWLFIPAGLVVFGWYTFDWIKGMDETHGDRVPLFRERCIVLLASWKMMLFVPAVLLVALKVFSLVWNWRHGQPHVFPETSH